MKKYFIVVCFIVMFGVEFISSKNETRAFALSDVKEGIEEVTEEVTEEVADRYYMG